ncbi:hypothetical protein KAI87_15995, partial [Myxococcota bacterium]|nr:hypothetical protein [Myxococcota bacterium]
MKFIPQKSAAERSSQDPLQSSAPGAPKATQGQVATSGALPKSEQFIHADGLDKETKTPDTSKDTKTNRPLQSAFRSSPLASTSSGSKTTASLALTPLWLDPALYTEVDLKTALKTDRPLTFAESMALIQTNVAILEDWDDVDLNSNLELFGSVAHLVSELQTQSRASAKTLYEAMKGAGTDEKAIIATLYGKTGVERGAIAAEFKSLLAEKGESTSKEGHGTVLERWINDEMSFGWLEMAQDVLAGNPIKPDAEYFTISAVAVWWNDFLKES